MRPSNRGDILVTLDNQSEIKAVEAGLGAADLEDSEFARYVFEAGHEADYTAPFDGKEYGPPPDTSD